MLATTEAGVGKCCSSEAVPVVCGISRIWTLASYRRHKVATRLLDVMRQVIFMHTYFFYIVLSTYEFIHQIETRFSFEKEIFCIQVT